MLIITPKWKSANVEEESVAACRTRLTTDDAMRRVPVTWPVIRNDRVSTFTPTALQGQSGRAVGRLLEVGDHEKECSAGSRDHHNLMDLTAVIEARHR